MAARSRGWSVFDGVKAFTPSSAAVPNAEVLMAEIDAAVASREHAHASALLRPFASPSRNPLRPSEQLLKEGGEKKEASAADGAADGGAGLAEEAYKAACAALAAGKPDDALRSLRVALVSCPPDKPSAISKIRSLMAFASSQHQRLLIQQKSPVA